MSTPAPAWLCLTCNKNGVWSEVTVPNAEFLRILRHGMRLERDGVVYLFDSYNKRLRTALFYESVTPPKDTNSK